VCVCRVEDKQTIRGLQGGGSQGLHWSPLNPKAPSLHSISVRTAVGDLVCVCVCVCLCLCVSGVTTAVVKMLVK